MNVMSNYSVTSADLMGLPRYMADGELVNGRVETSCKLHAAIPGVPNMCFKVVPGFLHALNALVTNTAAYGKNNTAYMAEVTNNGVVMLRLLRTATHLFIVVQTERLLPRTKFRQVCHFFFLCRSTWRTRSFLTLMKAG